MSIWNKWYGIDSELKETKKRVMPMTYGSNVDVYGMMHVRYPECIFYLLCP